MSFPAAVNVTHDAPSDRFIVIAAHIHRMVIESPNGSETVVGRCRSCSRVKVYQVAGEVWKSPYEEGGYYRPQSVPRGKLAEELAR